MPPLKQVPRAKATTGAGVARAGSVLSNAEVGQNFFPSKLPDSRQEAAALLKLTKGNKLNREEIIAAVQWEIARLAYFDNQLPDFWKLTADKRRPVSRVFRSSADEVLGHKDFPKRWSEVQKAEKVKIVNLLCGDQSTAARFLSGWEATTQARRFVQWYDDLETCRTHKERERKEKAAPKFLPMDDGGYVVLMRVYPGCGWSMIKNKVVEELKELGLPQDGRRNANDVTWCETILKGLAARWLAKGGENEKAQNDSIFKSQAAKSDYDLLRQASQRALDAVGNFVKCLAFQSREWAESKALYEQGEREFIEKVRSVKPTKRDVKKRK
jgi:hypothetical protein